LLTKCPLNTTLKKIKKGNEYEKEIISKYWMALRKIENTGT
jgi:hypothetical protein